jgi:23S rRNA pseudouridine1911/1915/1917 synthase
VTRIVPKPKNPSKGRNAPKKSVLHYRKVGDSELLIELFTGRHHQIRVQLANAGMPIVGDRKYGKTDPAYRGRLMLTAWQITFIHPKTKKMVTLTAE